MVNCRQYTQSAPVMAGRRRFVSFFLTGFRLNFNTSRWPSVPVIIGIIRENLLFRPFYAD